MNRKAKISSKSPHYAIVGAGPAGSSLAIRLAKAGFRVTLIERETFPRHKLCGEFISPECVGIFDELGLKDALLAAGARSILRTEFHAINGKMVTVPSEWFGGAALSLSRARMDSILLDEARVSGVDVFEGMSAVGIEMHDGHAVALKLKSDDTETMIEADVLVDATGRARILSKLLSRTKKIMGPKTTMPSLYVGYKRHLTDATIASDGCEMHSFPGGYSGLSPIEGGVANLCFIVTAEKARKMKGLAERLVNEAVFQNEQARRSLAGSHPAGDWHTVSIDSYGIREPVLCPNLFSIGDSAAFIDPFTGSGMLMAMESAKIFGQTVKQTANDLAELSLDYSRAHSQMFARRLRFSSIIRKAAFSTASATVAVELMRCSLKVSEMAAKATRSSRLNGKTLS